MVNGTYVFTTREFVCINENNNLVPGITRPTRITNTSATLIDNIFVSDTYVPIDTKSNNH